MTWVIENMKRTMYGMWNTFAEKPIPSTATFMILLDISDSMSLTRAMAGGLKWDSGYCADHDRVRSGNVYEVFDLVTSRTVL